MGGLTNQNRPGVNTDMPTAEEEIEALRDQLDVPDDGGCAEMWAALSELREEQNGETNSNSGSGPWGQN